MDPRSLKTALKSLPTGLDETYSRMITDIPEERKSAAMNILRILIFSDKPPSIEELADALAIDVTEDPTPRFDRDLRMPNPMEITNYCPGLIITHPNMVIVGYDPSEWSWQHNWKEITEVHLAHFSVKEFLTSDRLSDELKDCMGSDASRAYLTTICVTYLSGIQEKMSRRQILDVFPFAEWSARAWWEHAASRRQVKNKKIDDLIVNFLLFNDEAYLNSLRLHIPETRAGWGTSKISCPPAWGLYYACLYGMAMDVENILRHSPNVNASGGAERYPIHAAAGKGHAKLVQLLLSKGAAVDLLTKDGLTPLHLAATSGNEETVQHLLNANADIHAIGYCYKTVLGSACCSGNLSMVKWFVKLGVDISSPFAAVALGNACSCGYEDIVQFLIDLGIDPHTNFAYPWISTSPIGEAARKGYARIVQICLGVKFSGTITMTFDLSGPLYQAVCSGHIHIVRMILAAGQDVGVIDPDALVHPSPSLEISKAMLDGLLIRQCHRGEHDMILLLLERGADVNCVEADGTTCLEALLIRDHPELCHIILDKGYQVNLAPRTEEYPNRRYEGCPALAAACQKGNADMARILLRRGADVNTRTQFYFRNGFLSGPVLGEAVAQGHTTIAELLVEFGADTKLKPLEELYQECAYYAYEENQWRILKLIFDLGGNIQTIVRTACFHNKIANISKMHGWGVMVGTGLPVACYGGHLALVQFLLDHGADPDTEEIQHGSYDFDSSDEYNTEPSIFCYDFDRSDEYNTEPVQRYDSLRAASYGGYAEIVELLLDRGASVNRREASSINTPLMTAVSHSEAAHNISGIGYGKALQEVIQRHEGIHYPNLPMLGDFADALQAASYQGHEDVVRLLLAKGVDVNSPGGILGSAIAAAYLSGQYGIVRFLLSAGADAGASDGRALVMALVGGHEKIVSLLCGPEVDLTVEQREMAFWEAIKIDNKCCKKYVLDNIRSFPIQSRVDVLEASALCGNLAVVREVLKEGSNIWNLRAQPTVNPTTAPMIDEGSWYIQGNFNALHIAVQDRDVEMVRLLLEWSVDFTSPACRHTYLLKATEHRFPLELTEVERTSDSFREGEATSSEIISILLLEHGIDLSWPQEKYDDALIQSAKMGFAELIQVLFARGASPNDVKEWPLATLQLALDKGDNDFVRASNNSGAKIVDHSGNDRILSGAGPVYVDSVYIGPPDSTLLYAAADGRAEAVTICMSTASVMHFSNHMGATALHFAARYGHAEVVRTLLDIDLTPLRTKPDINAVVEGGMTALHLAAWYGHAEVIRTLLDIDSTPSRTKPDINAVARGGGTALHVAARYGYYECIRILLKAGANTTMSIGGWRSPLEECKGYAHNIEDFERYTACIDLLRNWKDAPNKDPHQVPATDKEGDIFLLPLHLRFENEMWTLIPEGRDS